ncbi:MAG: hypothetical protein AB8G18_17305 [Gammaproteobacteria bacterium]
MKLPKLNHYWAKSVRVDYWSRADEIALPVVGLILFSYLTWQGYKLKLVLMMLLTVPIAFTCLILLIGDFYYYWRDRRFVESNENRDESDYGR